MALNLYQLTATVLLNDVGIEIGLDRSADPVASTDKGWVSLVNLLNIAVEEIAELHEWQQFKREKTFVTNTGTNPQGQYDLPTDFHYMIDQTHWDRTNSVPLGGPLSSQTWQYLKGYSVASSSIYASFREQEGVLMLWPTPPTAGITIAYEYASINWIRNAADNAYIQRIVSSGDRVLLPPSVIRTYLKAKYLESKGFGSMPARESLQMFFDNQTAKNQGGGRLSLNQGSARYPYLDPYRNAPDSSYGA